MIANDGAGRAHLVPNVVATWVAHGLALVVGFVMPRLIDESIGQIALGVWDLGWSLTVYLGFSGLGMAAAIVHDVASGSGDAAPIDLRRGIASGFYCQAAFALVLGAAVVVLFAILPRWAPEAFQGMADRMFLVGLYLGAAILVSLAGEVAHAVLAGRHRTSWNEYLTVASDLVLAVAMIFTLVAGGGIVGLAVATLVVRSLSECVRFALAFRACPAMTLSPTWCRGTDCRRLLRFAGTSSLTGLQDLVVQQGLRLMLAIGAGPAALACYSRYQTLFRQLTRLMSRSAGVIPPMATDLAWQGRQAEIDRLRRRASKATAMISLPLIAVLAVLGEEIVLLWMGPEFVVTGLSWVLALLAALQIDFGVSSRVLAGLNLHGRITLICFVSSTLIVAVLYLALRPLEIIETAWIGVLALGLGVALPHYFLSCKTLGTPPGGYFRAVYLPTVVANGAFVIGLRFGHALFEAGDHAWAFAVGSLDVAGLAAAYWYFSVSRSSRSSVLRRLGLGTEH